MTPYVSWSNCVGNWKYGKDYSKDAYKGEYMLSSKNIHKSGCSGIYEVPPTILKQITFDSLTIKHSTVWLRPNGNNLEQMLWIKEKVKKNNKLDYLEFMLHSSELTAGTNPTFKNKGAIEKLYLDLEILFEEISKDFDGIGITDYITTKYGRYKKEMVAGNAKRL